MRLNSKKITIIVLCLLTLSFPFLADCETYSEEASKLYNDAYFGDSLFKNYKGAKQKFYKLIREYPDDIRADDARKELAKIHLSAKEYDKAIDMYKEIIAKSNNINNINNAKLKLSEIYYSTHRYREGIELLEEWLKSNEYILKKDEIACNLADFYLQTGNKDEAWLLLEKYMGRGSKKAFQQLLDLAIKSGEIDRLLNSLQTYKNRFKAADYYTYISDCYLAIGRKDKAIQALKEYERFDKDVNILKKTADIEISDNKIEDAIKTLEKAIEYIPYDWQCLRKLGHCYYLIKNKEKAIEVWKRAFDKRFGKNQEQYMNYISVLIEHQLLEEALKACDEGRKTLGIQTMFAEERAAVLDALGREKEALDEYINLLAEGIFDPELFDKLYMAKSKDFSLEEKLIAMNKDNFNQATAQALIEFYFRKARIEDIDKIVKLVDNDSAIFFDDFFYDRIRQEALLVPEEFHFLLIKKMIDARKESALELKLASLILRMPEYCEKWQKEAYQYSKNTADSEVIADSDLKYELYFNLANFVFEYCKSPKEADSYLSKILKRNIIAPSIITIIKARLLRAKLQIYMSKFDEAEANLKYVSKLMYNKKSDDKDTNISIDEILKKIEEEASNENLDDFSELKIYEKIDYEMWYFLEKARLKAHKGEYQESLNNLKVIIENNIVSNYVNDGLELALDITSYSLGDFSAINHKLNAARLIACGENIKALKELDEAIKALPASSTSLISNLEADKILISDSNKNFDEITKSINEFILKYPDSLRKADLEEYKIKLMQRLDKSQNSIEEEMKSFIANYPNDLRSGKYKLCLENGVKK